ncbi:MAG: Ni/Fe hydrogenase subunit alpha [candidate division WOR-3 bacterium]
MPGQRITIDPITRLEGHGKIEIFLDDQGEVVQTYLQVPELRGFEKFCEGRKAEDMPQLTSRICGVCPVAHHMAATKALDRVFGVEPSPTAKMLRELTMSGYYLYDHILHFFFLAGPDFIVGPEAPKAKRNILGVIDKVGLDLAKEVIKHRAYGQKITEILGGKPTHPVCGLPGGVSKGLSDEERSEIEAMARSCERFALDTLELFRKTVLENKTYRTLLTNPKYDVRVHSMGMVDDNNRVNFYDGAIRVVDTTGCELVRFDAQNYLEHIAEEVLEWSYVKVPYLRAIGFKGLVDGQTNGLYRVGPLGRLNASQGFTTPKAQAEYEQFYTVMGSRPVHSTLAYHWARLIELLYAAERAVELATNPGITGTDYRNMTFQPTKKGVGIVEAARGTLIHDYETTDDLLIKRVNLIVATTNNKGAIELSVRNAAKDLVHSGKISDSLLNTIEMFFRAYDPCFGCATHVTGQVPLTVNIRGPNGRLVRVLSA